MSVTEIDLDGNDLPDAALDRVAVVDATDIEIAF